MENDFCKIIPVLNHQVLIVKEYPEDDEKLFDMKVIVYLKKYMKVTFTLTFYSEDELETNFKEYDEIKSKAHVESLLKML
jgi:hypothetical protein